MITRFLEINSGIAGVRNNRPVMQALCAMEALLDLALPLFCCLLRIQLLQLRLLPGSRDRGNCSRVSLELAVLAFPSVLETFFEPSIAYMK